MKFQPIFYTWNQLIVMMDDERCKGCLSFRNGLCRNLALAKMQDESESVFVMVGCKKLGLQNEQNDLYMVCLSLV